MDFSTFLAFSIVIFLWLSYFPVSLVQVKAFARNRKIFVNKNLTRIHNDPFIKFQIMTRSARISDVVERGINSIVSSCKEASYSDYSITVVTEDPKDVEFVKGTQVLVVPKEYKTKNGAIRKARALQYACDERKLTGSADNPNTWIFHMDEESVVTSHTIYSLLTTIREKKSLISEGPIVYPYKIWDANRLAMLAESVRPFQCYECISQIQHPPAIHMHGSNLLVRADIEDSVGWDHGQTLAEDQLFGFKVFEKYGNIFGWHGGLLQEQPPLTLSDHFRQRKRWIKGTLENLQYLPVSMKRRIYLRVSSFWLGFLSALATTILYVYLSWPIGIKSINILSKVLGSKFILAVPQEANIPILSLSQILNGFVGIANGKFPVVTISEIPSAVITASLLFTFLIWLIGTQVGLKFNLESVKMPKLKRLSLHVEQLLLSPFVGMIETFPALVGLVEFVFRPRKNEDFHVIKK